MKIKDQEWCGDKGPLGAKCWHTLNNDEREITPDVWNALEIGPDHRFGKVCTDIENFTDTKAVILNLCKASKRCTYDAKQMVIKFTEKANNFSLEADKELGNLVEVNDGTI